MHTKNNIAVARAFTSGNCAPAEQFLHKAISWKIFREAEHIQGKNQVMAYCSDTSGYFQSMNSHFTEDGMVQDGDSITIYGQARYIRNAETIVSLNSCEIYQFDKQGFLTHIRSYCHPY